MESHMNHNHFAWHRLRHLSAHSLLAALFCAACFMTSCKKSANQAGLSQAAPDFTDAQNDSEGYDGKLWGYKYAVTGNILQSEEKELLGLAFNVPIRRTIVAGANLGESLDIGVLPTFTSESTGSVSYVYYNGELAMTLVTLDAHNYDSVMGTIEGKEYPRVSESSTSYRHLGDESDGDSTGLEQILYKRGNTNTRVYLMKYIERSPLGQSWSAYILYMPNHYYNLISTEIQNAAQGRNIAAASEAEQRADPDKQRVQ